MLFKDTNYYISFLVSAFTYSVLTAQFSSINFQVQFQSILYPFFYHSEFIYNFLETLFTQ